MIEPRPLWEKVSQNELIAAFCVFIVTALIISIVKKLKSKFPPGPYGLPFIGYLPFLTNKPHLKLIELSKKYGDIFSVGLGSKPVVILNNVDLIREALLKPEVLGRPPYGAFSLFKKQSPFFTCPVHIWQEQRKFVVQSMKDLGLGKSKIEEHIKDEINAFLEVLHSKNGKTMDLQTPLTPSISNNISALVFGIRYPYDNPIRKKLDQNLNDANQFLEQTTFFQIFPWIRHLPFINKVEYKKAATAFDNMHDLFKKQIIEHEDTLDPQNIRDYVDSYLIQMKSKKEKDPNTHFNEDTLVDSATDLFGAGSETVRTTISWLVYIMAAYPDIQKRVQKEILDVIGSERQAEFLDQKLMSYTHVVILEVLRWATIVPLNVLHYTTADTNIGGYNIPRDTAVLANIWAVHHDPNYWSDPDKFKPERFFGPDGKSIVKPLNYMPFSIGKRACPGETMAYMELFLYFVSMLQRFDIVFPDNYRPTFESITKLTQGPKDYMIRFINKVHN